MGKGQGEGGKLRIANFKLQITNFRVSGASTFKLLNSEALNL